MCKKDEKERLEAFERMFEDVMKKYDATVSKMEALKAEGKTKTVTYRQLLADKLMLGNITAMYKIYGLDERE